MQIRYHLNRFLAGFEREFASHNLIEVSRGAIAYNLAFFADRTGHRVIPVLKGNAYGHGIEVVAEALRRHPLDYIAVDGYFEALRVHSVSRQPVLVMGKIMPENYAHIRFGHDAFVVDNEISIEALAATRRPVKVHLEVNTGMNRYGCSPGDVERLTRLILSHRNLVLEGVMSHLADSDSDDPTSTDVPAQLFDVAVENVRRAGANPTIIHIAQTAGSLKTRSKYAGSVRLGIGLYGINPFGQNHPLRAELASALKPALRLTSTITQIHDLEAGDQVSYNYTFTAPHAMRIGVIPLGYHEGVNRALSNAGSALINHKPAAIVGRVCMNHTMVNLDEIPTAKVGDRVTVYSNRPGESNTVDAVAREHGLFNYNLLTDLSPDIRRRLVP